MLVISLHYQFKQEHSACFWQRHIYIYISELRMWNTVIKTMLVPSNVQYITKLTSTFITAWSRNLLPWVIQVSIFILSFIRLLLDASERCIRLPHLKDALLVFLGTVDEVVPCLRHRKFHVQLTDCKLVPGWPNNLLTGIFGFCQLCYIPESVSGCGCSVCVCVCVCVCMQALILCACVCLIKT